MRKRMTKEEKRAWYLAHTTGNRNEIEQSKRCGCVACTRTFDANDVVDYLKDRQGETAVCPRCMIDAVIGDACGVKLTRKLLDKLNKEWF